MSKKRNILDAIPQFPEHVELVPGSDDLPLMLKVHRRSRIERFFTRYFKAPAFQTLELDVFGAFVLSQIDGNSSVEQIAQAVRQRFGEEAEPLYERLIVFFKMLYRNKLITL